MEYALQLYAMLLASMLTMLPFIPQSSRAAFIKCASCIAAAAVLMMTGIRLAQCCS